MSDQEHTWLSQARREVELEATGQSGALGRLRSRTRDAQAAINSRISGARLVLLTLAVLAAAHAPFMFLPGIPGLPSRAEARDFVLILWQVSAGVLGIAFVILIFVIETIHRSTQGEFVWQRIARSRALYVGTAFMLGTILAIGFGSYALSPSLRDWLGAQGVLNLLVLDSLLFGIALLLILQLYMEVFRLINPRFAHELAVGALLDAVQQSISRTLRSRFEDQLLRQECEALGFRYSPGTGDRQGMQAVRLEKQGQVADVNLKELRTLAKHLAAGASPRAIIGLSIGRRARSDSGAAVFLPPAAVTDEIRARVLRCFRVSKRVPERTEGLNEAFSFLTEQALQAIELGRLEQLERVLEALQEPIRVAVETLKAYDLVLDAKTARNIFSFEWPAFDRPFREYIRIVEGVSRSPDGNLIAEVAGWPYGVMLRSFEQRDHYFFRQAVQHLTYLYRVSKGDATERARELLADRAWRHLKEFGSMQLAFAFPNADQADLARLEAYVNELFIAYASLLRLAVDAHDLGFLERAVPGLQNTFDADIAAGGQHVAAYIEYPELMQDLSDADRALARSLHKVNASRDVAFLTLAAWVCHLWQSSKVPIDVAQYFFGLAAQHLYDSRRLWRTFASALAMESHDRMPLSDWLLSEFPEGQVVGLRPEALIAQAYVLMALRNDPGSPGPGLEALGRAGQASWAGDQVNAALNEVRANLSHWEQLVGDTSQMDKEPAIHALMEAAQDDARERERQHLMEQPLSPAKLADFKADFLANWTLGVIFRQLFSEAGAIEYRSDTNDELPIRGFWQLMSKGAFVEDSGSTSWHRVGADFGTGMANGEDELIYDALRTRAGDAGDASQELDVELAAIMRSMTEEGFAPTLVLLSGGYRALRRIEQSDDFVEPWLMPGGRAPHLLGSFHAVPIYMHRADGSEFLVVSLPAAGRLVQHVAGADSIFREFEIRAFSREEAEGVANGDRGWLPTELREWPSERLVDHLREQVSIKINQSLTVEIANDEAIRKLTFSEDDSETDEPEEPSPDPD